ncbi:MAG: Wzz/FepE/Etk N-terminal domain-containing protein [Pseudomonadota bacterium]
MNKAYPSLNVPAYPAYGAPIKSGENALIDLPGLLQAARRRMWIMISAFVLTVSVVTIMTMQATEIFTTTTKVIVDSRTTGPGDELFYQNLGTSTAEIDTEVQIIKSRRLLERVSERMDLVSIPEFNPALLDDGSGPGFVEGIFSFIGGLFSGDRNDEGVRLTEQEKAQARFARAVRILENKISVTRFGATFIIDITVSSEDPRLATQLANTIADEYLVDQLNAKLEATERSLQFLSERLDGLRRQVTDAEAEVAEYKRQNDIQTAEGTTLTEQEITRVTGDLIAAEADLAERQARLSNVRNTLASGGNLDGVAEVLNSNVITDLRRQQTDVEGERAELRARYGPRHPEIIRINNEVADVEAKIAAEVSRIVSSLEGEVSVARQRITSLRNNRSQLNARLNRNNQAQVGLAELERNAESERLIYQESLDLFNEASSTEDYATPDARVLATATVPTFPSLPRTNLNIFLGIVLGSVLACGLVVVAELLDNYFSTAEDIERMFGLPSIGSIPLLTKLKGFGRQDMSPADYLIANPLSAFAESIRNLRASIIFADLDKESKVVAITSSLPDEGKTSITHCLGRMSAMAGAKTIIIDGDFRRRQLTEVIGYEPERGFIEHLFGEVALEDAIVIDEQTGLHILPLTDARNTPRDVFGSRAFDALMSELKKTYDLIVIDTGPILLMSESRVIASKADQVIVVAKWRSTSRWTVQETLNVLKEFNANTSGIAMTFVDLAKRKRLGYDSAAYQSYNKYYSTD